MLKEFFTTYGEVTSVNVEVVVKGESMVLGFVWFKDAENAKTCIDKTNKQKMDNGEELYVVKIEIILEHYVRN